MATDENDSVFILFNVEFSIFIKIMQFLKQVLGK
jgi:hypothetical protein